MSRYDPCETTAAFLINLNARKPDDKQCLASYASGLMSSLMSRWKDLTTEQIAIATVVSHVSLFEPRVQRLAFTTDITTRNQLHQELKAVSFLKRKGTHNDCDEPEPKKSHFSGQNTNIKCFFCGRLGHKSTQCLSKREANHNINRLKTDGSKKDTSLKAYHLLRLPRARSLRDHVSEEEPPGGEQQRSNCKEEAGGPVRRRSPNWTSTALR